jgi:O-antigen/teichoic acid export membrane protein
MSLNGLVAYLNFRIDAFLVLFMLGRQALGVYSIGIGLGELLFFISRPIVTAARGRIARSGERESAELSAKCLRHTFALVLLCSVAIYFAGPALVVLVYGKQFAGAGPVLRYLLPGVIAYSAMPVLSAFFSQQIGNPRIPLAFSTISTVLCALVTAAILPHVGIVGGAIATSVSYFTAFSLAVVYFMRLTGTPLSRMFFLDAQDLHAYKELAIAAIARQKALATRLTSR